MKGLTLQLVILRVEEGNDRPGLAEVAPGVTKHIALPSRLFGREPRGDVMLAESLGSTTASTGCGMIVTGHGRLQVTDPSSEGLAPNKARVERICSAYSRAN